MPDVAFAIRGASFIAQTIFAVGVTSSASRCLRSIMIDSPEIRASMTCVDRRYELGCSVDTRSVLPGMRERANGEDSISPRPRTPCLSPSIATRPSITVDLPEPRGPLNQSAVSSDVSGVGQPANSCRNSTASGATLPRMARKTSQAASGS